MKPDPSPASSTKPNWVEVGLVVGTGGLHHLFLHVLGFHGIFIALAVVGWTTYVVRKARQHPDVLVDWGFTRRRLRETFIVTSLVAVFGGAGLAAIGAARGHLALHWHMLPLLGLYPIWGVIQQFLVQGLFAANLAKTELGIRHQLVVVVASALVFASAHLPAADITLATFLLGMAFTPIYLRFRNLWPLGLYHGWLGLAFYFWVVARDPLEKVLSR